MSTEFYSKNKKKDEGDQESKKLAKRTDAIQNTNLLTAAFPAKSRKSPMRASYHGKTTYQHGYTDKKLLRADAFNVRMQRGQAKRAADNTASNPEVVGSAESLVSRVLQEQGLGKADFFSEKPIRSMLSKLFFFILRRILRRTVPEGNAARAGRGTEHDAGGDGPGRA